MKLSDLDPCYLLIADENTRRVVDTLAEAQGIMFLCPVCFQKNNGPRGTHSMICWFNGRGVPDDMNPKPGRWNPSGTGISDLSFVALRQGQATSVLSEGGCNCHFHIENGEIRIC